MKLQKLLPLLLAVMVSLATGTDQARSQTAPDKVYQQMSHAERAAFISAQARRIARAMSGVEYEFTASFEGDIQQAVDQYARRVGNNVGDSLGKGDARFVFERGQARAPTLIAAFKAHNLSPLIGLYIPWIESEYVN